MASKQPPSELIPPDRWTIVARYDTGRHELRFDGSKQDTASGEAGLDRLKAVAAHLNARGAIPGFPSATARPTATQGFLPLEFPNSDPS